MPQLLENVEGGQNGVRANNFIDRVTSHSGVSTDVTFVMTLVEALVPPRGVLCAVSGPDDELPHYHQSKYLSH
jgi:hypothetical protein